MGDQRINRTSSLWKGHTTTQWTCNILKQDKVLYPSWREKSLIGGYPVEFKDAGNWRQQYGHWDGFLNMFSLNEKVAATRYNSAC